MAGTRDWSLDGLVLGGLGREIEHDGKKERPLDAFRVRQADGGERDVLTGMGAVNVFVGANNSGKSRFMRELMMMPEWSVDAAEGERAQRLASYLRVAKASSNRLQRERSTGFERQVDSIQKLGSVLVSRSERQMIPLVKELNRMEDLAELCMPNGDRTFVGGLIWADWSTTANPPPGHPWHDSEQSVRLAVALSRAAPALRVRIYYPILRTLRPLGDQKVYTDHIALGVHRDYSLGSAKVTSGLEIFSKVQAALLGKRPERDSIRRYEQFLSREFFSNQQVTLTPHGKEGILYIEIDSVERPIHELGDGLQSIIILTLQPFLMQQTGERGTFFIEEPELYLHPGMQRKLLDFYIHDTSHLYFMTTHSNHLLDMSADWPEMAVFNFQKKARASDKTATAEQFLITPVDRGDESSLQLLGVRASSVFLVNATVWVEGVTDRLYVRQMLRMLEDHLHKTGGPGQRMEEDTHYSFVEYGGANITHWSFLSREEHPILVDRLCGHAILLADNDDDGKKKSGRRAELKARLGERYLETAGREIENMLPARAIQAVLRDLGEPTARVDAVTWKEYRRKKLGSYLDGLPDPGSRTYADEYGTLKDKTDFCRRAIAALSALDFKDLDPEVRAIILAIYNFIREKNDLAPLPLA